MNDVHVHAVLVLTWFWSLIIRSAKKTWLSIFVTWCQVLLKDQRRKEALMCYSSGTLSDIEICNWHVLVGPSPVCPEVWWSNWWLQRCKKWRLIQRRCSVLKGFSLKISTVLPVKGGNTRYWWYVETYLFFPYKRHSLKKMKRKQNKLRRRWIVFGLPHTLPSRPLDPWVVWWHLPAVIVGWGMSLWGNSWRSEKSLWKGCAEHLEDGDQKISHAICFRGVFCSFWFQVI